MAQVLLVHVVDLSGILLWTNNGCSYQPTYTEVLGIIDPKSASVVTMVVQMSYTLVEFDGTKQVSVTLV